MWTRVGQVRRSLLLNARISLRCVSVLALLPVLIVLVGGGSAAAAALPATGATTGPSNSGPSSVPAAPILASAQGEGLSVLATWLPNDPSDQVTSYTLTARPDQGITTAACPAPSPVSVSVSGSSSSAYVEGLCLGVPYTVSATAANSLGTGPVSNVSQPAVPLSAQPPQPPLFTGAVGRAGSAVVTWTAPPFDGGAAITSYRITARAPDGSVAQTLTAQSSATTATVSGLTDGTDYTLALVATNAVGDSAASTATVSPSPAYAPSAPTGLTVAPNGSGGIDVAWSAPADDGGSALTGYTITYQQATANSSGAWTVVSGSPAHTVTVSGSTTSAVASSFEAPSAAYLFSVTATNSAGTSQAVTAANGVSPMVGVKSTTIVLSASTVQAIATTTPTSITWDAPVPAQVEDLKTGDVLVAGVSSTLPDGLMQTVTSIDATTSGTTVTAAQASLGDVFTNMTMATSFDPASSAPAAGATASPAAQAQFVPGGAGVAEAGAQPEDIQLGIGASLGDTFSIEQDFGPLMIKAQASLSADFELDLSVNQNLVGWPTGVAVSAQATAGLELQGSFGIKGEKDFYLGEIDGAPMDFQIGPVPVVVEPKVPLYLTVNGQVAVNVTASAQVGGRLSWSSNDAGHLSVTNLSHPFHLDGGIVPGVSVTGEGSVGLKLDPVATLYGIGGPSVSFTADLAADVNFHPTPDDPFLKIGPSLKIGAGLEYDVFGFHGDLEATLGTTSYAAFIIQNAPSAAYTITGPSEVAVGASATYTAKRSDGQTVPTTWSVEGGVAGDQVSTGGVFSPASPGGRIVTLAVQDATGNAGTLPVTIGKPFDSPGGLSATQHAKDVGMDVSWTAPANTGDTPLADYVVTTVPSTGNHVISAGTTTLTLNKLTPGEYEVDAYAENTGGQLSAPATTQIYLTPPCGDTFTGADSSSWSDPGNWSEGHVPGDSEWVCTAGESVDVPSGTAAHMTGLQTDGSSITIEGSMEVDTYLAANGLTMSGPGTFIAGPGLTWNWQGASIDVNVDNEGTLTVDGNETSVVEGVTLTNDGTLNIGDSGSSGSGNALSWSNSPGTLVNDADGTINLADESGLNPGTVDNRGTINTTGTPTITNLEPDGGSLSGDSVVIDDLTVPSGGGTLNSTADAAIEGSVALAGASGLLQIPGGSTVKLPVGDRDRTGHE